MLGITTTNARVGGFRKKSSSYDADAAAFFARVTAAGGTLSGTEMTATNQLVLDMKSAGVWTAMKAVYPMVGASAAACAQNLKSSSFTGTFNGGWTYASTGVTPNGTNGYMDTAFNTTTELTLNNGSIGAYSRTDRAANAKTIMGNSINVRGNAIYMRLLTGLYAGVNDAINFLATSSTTLGFRQVSRSNSTTLDIAINGTANSVASASTGTVNYNVYLGAVNALGTAGNYDTLQIAYAYLGTQLTGTQLSNYYTAVQAFQTSLSRQV